MGEAPARASIPSSGRSRAHPDHLDHDEYVIEALGAGAAVFLIKNTEPVQLLQRSASLWAANNSCPGG